MEKTGKDKRLEQNLKDHLYNNWNRAAGMTGTVKEINGYKMG